LSNCHKSKAGEGKEKEHFSVGTYSSLPTPTPRPPAHYSSLLDNVCRRAGAFSPPPANPMTDFDTNQSFSLQPPRNTWTGLLLTLIASWVRGWLTSGCAVESFLLLAGPAEHWSVSRYTLLAGLNAAYSLAATSWLFHLAFASLCWPLVGVTCIVQYATVSSFTRNRLRSWLRHVHFYRDKIAFFHLPSLVIDTDLDGLMTVRGVTFSVLDLTIELHGIEVG
jgi:hypothetical protein